MSDRNEWRKYTAGQWRQLAHNQADEIERLQETTVTTEYHDHIVNEKLAEIERLTAERANYADRQVALSKQAKRIEELERQLRWLKSKAFVESRDFEKPGYHWQIHFNSTCATVDNAIKKAALKGVDDE